MSRMLRSVVLPDHLAFNPFLPNDGGDGGAGAGGSGGSSGSGSGSGGSGSGGSGSGGNDTPPWERDGTQFDAARAWDLLQKTRQERDNARGDRDKFKGQVDDHARSQMNDLQKAEADRDKFKGEVDTVKSENRRLKAAIKYGLDAEDLELLGTGTDEEIDTRAKRIADRLGGDGRGDGQGQGQGPRQQPRPRDMTGGGQGNAPADESDLNKLGESMFTGGR